MPLAGIMSMGLYEEYQLLVKEKGMFGMIDAKLAMP